MTTVCVSDCGFIVDGDGNLALKVGGAPNPLDKTLGEQLFCDDSGNLRVPDYGPTDKAGSNDVGVVDTGYAATPGDGSYRTLSESSLSIHNGTARAWNVQVIAKALGPQMKMTAGNSVQMAHALTTDIDSAAPLPVIANFSAVARLNPAFLTATGATDYLEEQYPTAFIQRIISLASGSTLYLRYRVSYKTLTFRSDSKNAVGVDLTEIYALGVS